jgi:hypothetical protein
MLHQFTSEYGLVVRNGPFRGLKYVPESYGSSLLPKLLGTYEGALQPELALFLQRRYDTVINIGCAEGYYAVGFANQWPGVRVIAFDMDPAARETCARLAALNGVANQVTILGACNPERLANAIGHRSLIISDCEGCEAQLLDPDTVEGLERCDLIVELHPMVDTAIPGLIEARFKKSHDSVLVRGRGAQLEAPELSVFRWFDRKLATYEERSGEQGLWAVLLARAGDSASAGHVPTERRRRSTGTPPSRGEMHAH